jgi:hypothetical protein
MFRDVANFPSKNQRNHEFSEKPKIQSFKKTSNFPAPPKKQFFTKFSPTHVYKQLKEGKLTKKHRPLGVN